MAILVDADGPILERILDDTYPTWGDGLTRSAYGRFYAAQVGLPWSRGRLRRLALVDEGEVLASTKWYVIDAVLDGTPMKVCGIGAVFTSPASRKRGAARDLIEQVLARAAAEGADLALLFSEIGSDYYEKLGFVAIPTTDKQLRVTESTRYGAPMTMVRGGDDRDLADIAPMGFTRAEPFRFHLARDRDFIHFAIARKRLLAGFAPLGERSAQFFIAEEGASAAAYVVISAHGNEWTLEEAGDRDPSGARVGAILQALIAREPSQVRPSIRSWLPAGFLPPQVMVIGEKPSAEVMMIKPLTDRARAAATLGATDVLYWRSDLF